MKRIFRGSAGVAEPSRPGGIEVGTGRRSLATLIRGTWTGRIVAATAGAAASVALLGMMPASAHSVPVHARSIQPTAPQLHQLDFMLGAWTCVNTIAFPGRPTVVNNLAVVVRPTVDGHWYQLDSVELPQAGEPGKLISRWVFGWNAADNQFTAYYFDNNDSHGYATSAGLVDGVFAFVGPYTSQDNFITTEDAFKPIDKDHFVDDFAVNLIGHTPLIPAGDTTCTRLGH